MQVTGSNDEPFTEADIAISAKRDRMRSMVLRNELGEIVVLADHSTKKHFRVLGRVFGEKLVKGKKKDLDPTHDKCIRYIEGHLKAHAATFQIVSWVFTCDTAIAAATGRPVPKRGEKRIIEKQVIAQPAPDTNYAWFRGSAARARFEDQRYIEPDIDGHPQNSMQPTGGNPGIVIEVVRTHPPDQATFERLFQLSKVAHLVIFYVIPEGDVDAQFNRVWLAGPVMELTVSFYLLDGKFFERGVHIPETGISPAERHAQFVKGVLAQAMREARSP